MRKQLGYTILELMITVAIGAILTAIALPGYRNMIRNNCLTTNVNSLVSSLQLARSEAIKRKSNVTVTATNAATATNEWGTGWTVTINEDRNGNGVLDAGEDYNGDTFLNDGVGANPPPALVRTVTLTCPLTTINETISNVTFPAPLDIVDSTSFTYTPNGVINTTGTFEVCDERVSENGRRLTISTTGRPSLNPNFTCP